MEAERPQLRPRQSRLETRAHLARVVGRAGLGMGEDEVVVVLLAGPTARPERAQSWTIANRCRRVAGRRQPALMFTWLEFSDVCRCRDGGPLRCVSVHTD